MKKVCKENLDDSYMKIQIDIPTKAIVEYLRNEAEGIVWHINQTLQDMIENENKTLFQLQDLQKFFLDLESYNKILDNFSEDPVELIEYDIKYKDNEVENTVGDK